MRRFVFDEAASTSLRNFVRACGDLIIENRQFAIPPVNPCLIDIDIDAMIRAMGRGSSADDRPLEERDSLASYAFVGRRIYEASRGFSGHKAVLSPLMIEILDIDVPEHRKPEHRKRTARSTRRRTSRCFRTTGTARNGSGCRCCSARRSKTSPARTRADRS